MLNCFLNLFMEMTFEMKVLSRPSRWNPQNLSSLYMQSVCKMNSFLDLTNPAGVLLCHSVLSSSIVLLEIVYGKLRLKSAIREDNILLSLN